MAIVRDSEEMSEPLKRRGETALVPLTLCAGRELAVRSNPKVETGGKRNLVEGCSGA